MHKHTHGRLLRRTQISAVGATATFDTNIHTLSLFRTHTHTHTHMAGCWDAPKALLWALQQCLTHTYTLSLSFTHTHTYTHTHDRWLRRTQSSAVGATATFSERLNQYVIYFWVLKTYKHISIWQIHILAHYYNKDLIRWFISEFCKCNPFLSFENIQTYIYMTNAHSGTWWKWRSDLVLYLWCLHM